MSPSIVRQVLRKSIGLAKRLRHPLLLPLELIAYLLPRRSDLWVFGSWYGQRFADNPKYFFLYCHRTASQSVKAVWISKNREVIRRIRALGLPAFHALSPIGIWYACRAGVYVIDCRLSDVNGTLAGRALRVNLWHGVPLKRIERDIVQPDHPVHMALRGPWWLRFASRLLRPEFSERYDCVLATSDVTAARFASAFGVGRDHVILAGYPRADPLIRPLPNAEVTDEERALRAELDERRRAGARVLFYMPTFRDWRNSAERVIPLPFDELQRMLDQRDAYLYCKLHPSDRAHVRPPSGASRIRLLASDVDPYQVLSSTDALITDYSSIYFDYLLLNRPIIFYAYDLDEYRERSRTLYDEYEAVTPGCKARKPSELLQLLDCMLSDYSGYARAEDQDRATVRALAHKHQDDGSSERLLHVLLDRMAVRARHTPTS